MRTGIATVAVLLCLVAANGPTATGQAPAPAPPAPVASHVEGPALIEQYCMGCHSDRVKLGGLALSQLNLDTPGANPQSAEIAEKVVRKLRGGLMPPAGAKRPSGHDAAEFVSFLENKIDTAATESRPGRVPLRRLNRREYGYAIRDLLGFNIDATAWL